MSLKLKIKEMINKYLTKKAGISYLEILILVSALFAFSYLIDNQKKVILDNGEDSFNLFGRISSFSELFKINLKSVDAQGFGSVCCEETINGNTCQTALSENCRTGEGLRSVPTDCENTDFCEIGCCISSNTGLCNERTSKRDCEKINGTFKEDESCNIQECKKGCCILGDQAKWTTEANCKFEGNTEHKDLLTEWKYDENSNSELKCLFNVEKDKEGACVFKDKEKKCVFTTLEECVSRTGSETNFAKDTFCSNPELNTTCKAKDHKNCVEKEEDVYWFDSCGNKEDIAQDCDLYRGDYCKKKGDKVSCEDVNCDTNGDGTKDRKNGESWCTYDGIIGNGKDPAGSRHIKHICYMGTERIAPCADFRNEICVQEDTLLEDGQSMSQAACRVNQWRTCLDYNKPDQVEKMEKLCNENPDCWVKEIDMKGSFHFKVCLPSYPPGFELNFEQDILNENGSLNEEAYYKTSSADGICSISSMKCTSTWKIGLFCPGCVDNCDCHTQKFTREMNDFCISLGDCGGYINYKGEYTDEGYNIKGTEPPSRLIKASQLAFKNSNVYGGKPAEPGNLKFFQTLNPELLEKASSEYSPNLSAFEKELMEVSGAYGSPLLLKILSDNGNETSVLSGIGSVGSSILFSRFTSAGASVQAAISSQIIPEDEEKPADFSMIAAMIAGLVAYLITNSLIFSMIASLLAFLFFMPCITITKDVYFTCSSWTPPYRGDMCKLCNEIDVPCTEYRCESLGTNCKLINKGTGNEICIAGDADESFPKISPLESVITKGFKYNIKDNGFEIIDEKSEGCIEPYTSVKFGIKISPFSKCKWGNDPKESFEDMNEFFGAKGNYFLPAHITTVLFPNPEAFRNSPFNFNLTQAQIEELGKWDFYVKCKSSMGKTNTEPYHIKTCIKPGPDLTSPRIVMADPLNKAFVKYGIENKDVTFYINEPSKCKLDLEDKEFNEMNNTMSCETNPAIFTQFGWKCKIKLTLENNTKFYVKCQDTSENKNTMTESYVYELQTSKYELFIDEIIPKNNEIIISGVEPVSAKFKLKTSKGANNGEAVCKWNGNSYGDAFRYANENGSDTHVYQLTSLREGKYNINFTCEDIAGNKAENSTSFTIKIDKFGAKITRVYYDYGLKVSTDENSKECRYSFNRKFEYENSTIMSGREKEFTAPWYLKTYYIQCKDEYNNKGNIIRVKPVG